MGEEIAFEKWQNFRLSRARDLELDFGSVVTVTETAAET